jgi:hypothetical protein
MILVLFVQGLCSLYGVNLHASMERSLIILSYIFFRYETTKESVWRLNYLLLYSFLFGLLFMINYLME